MHDEMHPQLRLYLLGLVSARLGDTIAALRYADSITTIPADSMRTLIGSNLATGIRARVTHMRGAPQDALAQLGQPWLDPRTHGSHRSSILSQVSERYLRAELLRESGRTAEAINAYGAVSDYAVDGLMYLAPSHFRRGEIYAQMGDREQAAAHYRRVLDLWRDCDPALRPMRDTAERRLSELARR
jgi:tetratricopeptide (TPR) repeat protein